MKIGVFSISSNLHNPQTLEEHRLSFLNELENRINYEFVNCGNDFSLYGDFDLDIIHVLTGGTESVFRDIYPKLSPPFLLLASGSNNSLAASMEILSFLRERGQRAEIIHGDIDYIAHRVQTLTRVRHAIGSLSGRRYGIIGPPSDWLIASDVDRDAVRKKLGIELVDVGMDEFFSEINRREYPEAFKDYLKDDYDSNTMDGALNIYGALARLTTQYGLSGFTVRCFDLISSVCNTGCLAAAILNREGIVAGCEGDVPSLLSMAILHELTGKTGFQANPSRIDVAANEIIFAHCTVPLDMVDRYQYASHFESGIGLAIRGEIPMGDATVFKVAGDLSHFYVSDARIVKHFYDDHLCRTQIRVRPQESVRYFLTESIGNHHIIQRGHHAELIKEFFRELNLPNDQK